MKQFMIIVAVIGFLLVLSSRNTPTQAQPFGPNDCDDHNGSINPGITESGILCSNFVDDDCDGLIDCLDDSCGGSWGPNSTDPKQCCVGLSDCNGLTTGTCGQHTCTNNQCYVIETPSRCEGQTFFECDTFAGSCTQVPQVGGDYFDCELTDNVSLCSCDETCSGSSDYLCEGILTSGCLMNHSACVDASGDPFREPTDPGQCICHGQFETCGGP